MSDSYPATTATATIEQEDCMIREAISVLEQRLFQRGPELTSLPSAKRFLQLKLAPQKHEVFGVVFLDTRHRVISFEILFHGTIHAAPIYPRLVLQRAMELNCAAMVLAHNHPSGDVSPSQADRMLTQALVDLLAKVDVRVLDHFIVGSGEAFSFAEAGLI
nr:JAB domain-containing protein [Pseudomonas huaxiensis]